MAKQDNRRPKSDTGEAEIYTAEVGPPPVEPDMGSVKGAKPVVTPKPAKKMAKGGRVKRYNDGGITQQPTYPFGTNVPATTMTSDGFSMGGVNQTFNMQPQATAQPAAPTSVFKKGGKVSGYRSTADGIAKRGKTKGRMV